MHPLNDDDLPQAPAIKIDLLRSLLADVPDSWRLVADERSQLLLIDADEQARGYVDIVRGRIVLINNLHVADTGTL